MELLTGNITTLIWKMFDYWRSGPRVAVDLGKATARRGAIHVEFQNRPGRIMALPDMDDTDEPIRAAILFIRNRGRTATFVQEARWHVCVGGRSHTFVPGTPMWGTKLPTKLECHQEIQVVLPDPHMLANLMMRELSDTECHMVAIVRLGNGSEIEVDPGLAYERDMTDRELDDEGHLEKEVIGDL